jgi:hypothetical protein
MLRLLVTANIVPSSPILVTLMKEAIVPTKRRYLQEPHGVTSQKMAFFSLSSVYYNVNFHMNAFGGVLILLLFGNLQSLYTRDAD